MARPRTNIKERILKAARHEFWLRGVDASSLRAIARRARTSIGMIYYYFPSKDDLFLGVIEEPYANIVAAFAATLGTGAPPRERIRALFRRIGAFTPDEAETFRLVVREALMSAERRSLLLARAWRGHFPLIFQTVEGGQRDGALDASIPTPLLVIATAAVGVLPQVAATAVPQLGLVPGEALADRLADLLFDGIAAPHSPAISQGT